MQFESVIKPMVTARFDVMVSHSTLFNVDYDRAAIWDAYLGAFAEDNRQSHNCNCCKAFIRQVGGAVIVGTDSSLSSVWDVEGEVPEEYAASFAALSAYVKSRPIHGLYFHENPNVGTDKNLDKVRNIVWHHFHVKLPKAIRDVGGSMVKKSGKVRNLKGVLKRGLEEITPDAIDTVLELIAQGSLYRGETYKSELEMFKGLQATYKDLKGNQDNECWAWATKLPPSVAGLKNALIGTLLVDLSEGKELEHALKAFDTKAAPENYKRPTALVTPKMIAAAKANLQELGLIGALDRRRLDTRDLSVANALFVYRPKTSAKDVFAELAGDTKVDLHKLAKVEEIGIETFIEKVLPTATAVRVLFENHQLSNLVTMTGPQDPDAKSIMKWDNSFAWSYFGGVADSLRAKVAALGGRVDGVLRFSHTWNYDPNKPNQSLMDLHVFMPGSKGSHVRSTPPGTPEIHNSYPTAPRIGWNNRSDHTSGGIQDVDFVDPPGTSVPVENITFPSIKRMPAGTYVFKIHNWSLRPPTQSGFQAEIEFGGQTHQYHYEKALRNHEWITLAEVELSKGEFTIKHILPPSSASVTKWGLTTGTWRTVKAITLSPNHWTRPAGLKHWFFVLDGCVSDERTRPFLNEHLCAELSADRKVTEVLGSKIDVAPAEGAELSGLGFSESTRNHMFVEVESKFKRIVKVLF